MKTLEALQQSRPASFRELIRSGILKRKGGFLEFNPTFSGNVLDRVLDMIKHGEITNSDLQFEEKRVRALLMATSQVIDIEDYNWWTLRTLRDLFSLVTSYVPIIQESSIMVKN